MKKSYLIYVATNKINGKKYVGKTYNFEKRKREHLYAMDDDIPFHRALKKYSFENFEWEIIDRAKTESEIAEKEVYWIKELNTCIHASNSNGYNITIGGEGGVSWNSRPVVQFDLDGKYVNEYLSCSHAELETKIYRHGISDCARGVVRRAGDYQWRFKDECNGVAVESFIKPISSKSKKIIQLDVDGDFINIFASVTDASKSLNISRTSISGCLTGKNATAGGYQWIYENDYNPCVNYKYEGIREGNGIVQLDDDWNVINRFNNCAEAARYLNEPAKVHKLIHKRLTENKKCRGYYWRKYDDYVNGKFSRMA